jgi:hypothetical protein
MNDSDPRAGLPWYRYFWPWFIVVLLSTTVIAGIVTVIIAFSHRDSLVSESWYENGEQINRRIAFERNATRRSIRAELRVDDATGEVRLDLTGEGVGSVLALALELSHPTRASSDQTISLVRSDAGAFRGQLAAKLSGRWYATLAPQSALQAAVPTSEGLPESDHDAWRIATTLRFPSSEPLILGGSG